MAKEREGGIDLDSATGLYALLRSIEWVTDTIGITVCSRCNAQSPEHAANCELAANIARERALIGAHRVLADVKRERRHQIEDNNHTSASDDRRAHGELADAAATWIAGSHGDLEDQARIVRQLWPFDRLPKFKGQRADLIRGIAVAVAEVERLDRLAARKGGGDAE